MFSTAFTLLSVLLLFPLLIAFLSLCTFLILFYITQMRFSRSAHLRICLYLETLASNIRTGEPIQVKLIYLVNFVIILQITSNDLTQMFNFPTWITDSDSHSPAYLDFFLSSNASICSAIDFHPLENSDHVVVSVSIYVVVKIKTGCPVSSHSLWLFLCW